MGLPSFFSTLVSNFLVRSYAAVNRLGILELPGAQKIYESAYFFYKMHFEDPFYQLARTHPEIFENGEILDVGANIGYTAMIFAEALSDGFRVHAFEPEQNNFNSLQLRVRTSKFVDKIIPIHAAIGAHSGHVEIWENKAHKGDHRVKTKEFENKHGILRNLQKVPLWSLDDYGREKLNSSKPVSLIKIDVQGFEFAICEGMTKLLEDNPKASVVFEYGPHIIEEMGYDPHELLDYFSRRNYRFYLIEKTGRLIGTTPKKIAAAITGEDYADILCSKRDFL
ncbi:MAG: FkbM family methyltransferase [Deltaproteobacteria bacterium]|nr:FkbM family methyltransferase [Deltaproteobacteria bacterium]